MAEVEGISRARLEAHLLNYEDVSADTGLADDVVAYRINRADSPMFALLKTSKQFLSLSLRCDRQLSQTLQAKYESVLPGQNLNKRNWITILLHDQLAWPEIVSLVEHSYNLVREQLSG